MWLTPKTQAVIVSIACGLACDEHSEDTEEPLGQMGKAESLGTTASGFPVVGLFNRSGELHCSGVVIDASRVLTAAHCLVSGPGARITHVADNPRDPNGGFHTDIAGVAVNGAFMPWPYLTDYDLRPIIHADLAIIYLKTRYLGDFPEPLLAEAETLPDDAADYRLYGFNGNHGLQRSSPFTWVPETLNFGDNVEMPAPEHRGEVPLMCKGSSGGPLTAIKDGKTQLAGITSHTTAVNAEDCTPEGATVYFAPVQQQRAFVENSALSWIGTPARALPNGEKARFELRNTELGAGQRFSLDSRGVSAGRPLMRDFEVVAGELELTGQTGADCWRVEVPRLKPRWRCVYSPSEWHQPLTRASVEFRARGTTLVLTQSWLL